MSEGMCVVTALWNGATMTGVRVDQADPHIKISTELVAKGEPPHVLSGEGLFVINAVNGTYRYRLGTLVDAGTAWTADLLP